MKLSDIPKNQVFKVPEGYFDRLPGIIQARTAPPYPRLPLLLPILRYAIPVLAIGIVAWALFQPGSDRTPEEILATVHTEELIEYLNDTDISLHDILNNLEPEGLPADAIEQEVFDSFIDQNLPEEDIWISF